MEERYRIAFCEISFILANMQKNNLSKIPKKFIEFINMNKDKTYVPNLPSNALYHKELLKRETKIILSLIYRNYLCSSEEKRKLELEDVRQLNNIFKPKEMIKEKENKELIIYKKINIIDKIKNFILSILKNRRGL